MEQLGKSGAAIQRKLSQLLMSDRTLAILLGRLAKSLQECRLFLQRLARFTPTQQPLASFFAITNHHDREKCLEDMCDANSKFMFPEEIGGANAGEGVVERCHRCAHNQHGTVNEQPNQAVLFSFLASPTALHLISRHTLTTKRLTKRSRPRTCSRKVSV